MNSFEKQIRNSILCYPSIFSDYGRISVLDHLFCTIGNGYEWKNGKLVSEELSEHEIETYYQFDKWINREKEFGFHGFNDHLTYDECFEEQYFRNVTIIPKIERLATTINPYVNFGRIHTNYSKLFTFPDNVKPEWFEGMKETISLIIEAGNHPEWINEYEIFGEYKIKSETERIKSDLKHNTKMALLWQEKFMS